LIETQIETRALKAVEEELHSSQSQLRLIIDAIPTVFWGALPDGSDAFVNQRWLEYTGMPAEQAAQVRWQAVFPPEDIGEHVERWRASLVTGQAFENEARLRRAADGEYRWFLIHGTPLHHRETSFDGTERQLTSRTASAPNKPCGGARRFWRTRRR
jgi:PAS domain S-box-containing protein